MNLRSWGYCTKNANGFIEVNFEKYPSIIDRIFKRETKFVFEYKTKGFGDKWVCINTGQEPKSAYKQILNYIYCNEVKK